ncbi:MAG TPA: hypothetical protein VM490_02365 [Armatimonadaceae bacterium]|nr:hypothetical protein [Armatimonadaceae bacterium]
MTFGDVLIVVAGILATAATLWAAIVVFSLIFIAKAQAAAERLERRPGATLGVGASIFVFIGLLVAVLANSPGKALAWLPSILLLALAVLGSSGIAVLVSQRIRRADEHLSAFASVGRAAALMVAAGMMPIIGWFAILPVALLYSLGAGWHALVVRPAPVPASHAPEPISAEGT